MVSAIVASADPMQTGPAQIVCLPGDGDKCNFSLGQEGSALVIRFRTYLAKWGLEDPVLVTPDVFSTSELRHLVVTYDGAVLLLFMDGVRAPETLELTAGGTLFRQIFPAGWSGPGDLLVFKAMFYVLVFAPLGVLSALAIAAPWRGRKIDAALLAVVVVLPPVLFENVMVEVSGKVASLQNILAGVVITVGTALWLSFIRGPQGGRNGGKTES